MGVPQFDTSIEIPDSKFYRFHKWSRKFRKNDIPRCAQSWEPLRVLFCQVLIVLELEMRGNSTSLLDSECLVGCNDGQQKNQAKVARHFQPVQCLAISIHLRFPHNCHCCVSLISCPSASILRGFVVSDVPNWYNTELSYSVAKQPTTAISIIYPPGN